MEYSLSTSIKKMTAENKPKVGIVMGHGETSPNAMGQDPLGKQGNRVARNGGTEVWKKPLTGGALAVALLNRGEAAVEIKALWKDLGLKPGETREIRDLWLHKDLGSFTDSFSTKVEPHATVLVKVSAQR